MRIRFEAKGDLELEDRGTPATTGLGFLHGESELSHDVGAGGELILALRRLIRLDVRR